jgi:hypothetical protein
MFEDIEFEVIAALITNANVVTCSSTLEACRRFEETTSKN